MRKAGYVDVVAHVVKGDFRVVLGATEMQREARKRVGLPPTDLISGEPCD